MKVMNGRGEYEAAEHKTTEIHTYTCIHNREITEL